MGLLHKNLILAGMASVAMVGFLNSSSASAIDGFSFSDVINNYRNQTEQLQLYLTNPFGSGCEATNPGSTISCNETPFPNLLYSASSKENLWGHDGKGLVFANNNNLVNGDPQLATANRGDKLKFSIAIEAENYYDDEKTDPIARYMFGSLNSCGLAVDRSSAIVKVNNQVVSADAYNVELYDIPKEEAEQAGYDFCNEFIVSLDWVNESDTLLYAEGSTIEFTYEATIEDDAPSEVFGRGVYVYTSKAGQEGYSSRDFMTNTTFQATAITEASNIIIRRLDRDGDPLAKARFTIDGVRAKKTALTDAYEYDPDGSIYEFETNEKGEAIITGVPEGKYTAIESYSPNGHTPENGSITKTLSLNDYIVTSYDKYDLTLTGRNMTSNLKYFDENQMAYGPFQENILSYNADSQEYSGKGLFNTQIKVHKISDSEYSFTNTYTDDSEVTGRFVYDTTSASYKAVLNFSDYAGRKVELRLSFSEDRSIAYFGGYSDTGGDGYAFEYSDEDGCYHGRAPFSGDIYWTRLCQDGEYFRAHSQNDYYDIYLTMKYDEELGSYIIEYPAMIASISDITDDSMKYSLDILLNYSEKFDQYIMLFGSDGASQVGLTRTTKISAIVATEFLFQDKTANAAPEDIPNPQTSDAVLKAIIIASIGLAPFFVLRKQLTKRAN